MILNLILGFMIGFLGMWVYVLKHGERDLEMEELEKLLNRSIALSKKYSEYVKTLQMQIGELKDKERYGTN